MQCKTIENAHYTLLEICNETILLCFMLLDAGGGQVEIFISTIYVLMNINFAIYIQSLRV